jgi:hypothetical protein
MGLGKRLYLAKLGKLAALENVRDDELSDLASACLRAELAYLTMQGFRAELAYQIGVSSSVPQVEAPAESFDVEAETAALARRIHDTAAAAELEAIADGRLPGPSAAAIATHGDVHIPPERKRARRSGTVRRAKKGRAA